MGAVKRKQTEEIKILREAIAQLETENRTQKTRIDLLQKRLEDLPIEITTKLMKRLEELGLAEDETENNKSP